MNNNQLAVVRESAQLIPQPTAELIEKSFAQNTTRNRRHPLQKFGGNTPNR